MNWRIALLTLAICGVAGLAVAANGPSRITTPQTGSRFGSVTRENETNEAFLCSSSSHLPAQEQFNQLDAAVAVHDSCRRLSDGLMSHVVYPEGNGFVVAEVWRTKSDGHHHVDDVLRPLVGGLSLTAKDTHVPPV